MYIRGDPAYKSDILIGLPIVTMEPVLNAQCMMSNTRCFLDSFPAPLEFWGRERGCMDSEILYVGLGIGSLGLYKLLLSA